MLITVTSSGWPDFGTLTNLQPLILTYLPACHWNAPEMQVSGSSGHLWFNSLAMFGYRQCIWLIQMDPFCCILHAHAHAQAIVYTLRIALMGFRAWKEKLTDPFPFMLPWPDVEYRRKRKLTPVDLLQLHFTKTPKQIVVNRRKRIHSP